MILFGSAMTKARTSMWLVTSKASRVVSPDLTTRTADATGSTGREASVSGWTVAA